MREGTLVLFYIVKFAELVFLITWTTMMIISGFQFLSSYGMKSIPVFGLTILSFILAVYHVLYINLLINMRFRCKMKSVFFGRCIFDCFNCMICYCCLRTACRDRCFKWPTIVKWVIKGGIFGYLFFAVRAAKAEAIELGKETESVPTYALSYFDTYLLIYALQHPIFMVARIPLFIVYSLLTCCCDKGQEFSERETFDDRIISFDFIDRELEELDNFQNHPQGLANEVEFNRNLSIVRERRISLQNSIIAQQQMGSSNVQKMRSSIKRTILTKLSMSQQGSCPICTIMYEPRQKLTQLACHKNHMLHDECYNDYITFMESKNQRTVCPLCRKDIDKNAVKKIQVEDTAHNENPFAMDNIEMGGDMERIAAKNAAADAGNPEISAPIQGEAPQPLINDAAPIANHYPDIPQVHAPDAPEPMDVGGNDFGGNDGGGNDAGGD